MNAIDENEEKIFGHYLELPENARTEVIDQMEPDDRIRFTRCSKLCSKEAQASKNYVHALKLFCREDYADIEVKIMKTDFHQRGFRLSFVETSGKKYKEYHNLNYAKLWGVELDSSTDMIQCAIEELKYRMKIYQGSMKALKLVGFLPILTNVDFEIKSLNNLETLDIFGTVDISQFVSKLQKPLKELCIYGTNNTSLSSNYEQIYQVQNEIYWPYANFDIEQLQRLTAKNVETFVGPLTEKNIIEFIRSWQNGTIGKEIETYTWFLDDSDFDKKKLRRLLRVQNRRERKIEIKHYNDAGKRAVFLLGRSSLKFCTIPTDFEDSDLDSNSDV